MIITKSMKINKEYKVQMKIEKEREKHFMKLKKYAESLKKKKEKKINNLITKIDKSNEYKLKLYRTKERKKLETRERILLGKKPLKKDEIKKNNLPKLKKKLFTLVQEYARLRDSNEFGIGSCISCGKKIHWKLADGGHYISRTNMSTAFDERNINLQCKYCNGQLHGNSIEYRKHLIEKIGLEQVQEIELKKYETKNRSEEELQMLITTYEIKNEQLLDKKRLN